MARARPVLPGFRPAMSFTLIWLSVIVLIPLATVVWKTSSMGWSRFFATIATERAVAAYALSFGAAAVGAAAASLMGVFLAWVLVRYDFPGRTVLDALVDLPFALPTAVSGIALTAIYSPRGWIGRVAAQFGVQTAFSRIGIVIALTFVALPFVVRTVQPVLEELEPEAEEAAAVLGANRWTVFLKVLLPPILPALITGFALAFGRALGEYGSVVFISGNMPMKTEVAPLLIMTKLEQFDYEGATAIALVMLLASFALLFGVNRFQAYTRRRTGAA